MPETTMQLPEVHLMPGEIHVARRPAILKTVLGSCVSVTFWSERLGIGALSHGVLPLCPEGIRAPEGYRYVDFAICDLLRQFEAAGALRSELQIKVFGGADVLPHLAHSGRETVGHQNWKAAVQTLHAQNLEIMASDLGGEAGRILQFHTDSGDVLLRRLAQFSEHVNEIGGRL
jgi:chemotaxis protein CheD